MLWRGMCVKEIAAARFRSEKTVATQLHKIYEKSQTSGNRMILIRWALERGYITWPDI